MKRLLALLLIILMVSVSLVACGSNTDESKNESNGTTSNTSENSSDTSEPDENNISHLEGLDFGGADVVFYVEGDATFTYRSMDIMPHEEGFEEINEAVKVRNQKIEDLLNVKIVERRAAAEGEIMANVRADNAEADIIMPYMPVAATLASESMLLSLNIDDPNANFKISDIIKLDKPYWDQRANQDLSIANNLFIGVGDFGILTMDCAHAIVFNKTLLESDNTLDDPYELLFNGKWTHDALMRNAKKVTKESDGEDGMTYKDTWGFYVNQNYCTTLYVGSGLRLTNKDKDDYPELGIANEQAANVIDKIASLYNDSTMTLKIEEIPLAGSGYSSVWVAASDRFATGNVLFRACAIIDLRDLLSYEVQYGILPTPKYTEEQEEYRNILSAVYAAGVSIPVTASDIKKSAAVVEALSYYSTDTVRLEYYERILKAQRMEDTNGEKALDMIFNNRVYELGAIYSWNNLNTFVNEVISSGQYQSTLDAKKDLYQTAIDNTILAYKN
ncbi:hypothetical protein LJB90_00290 [Eubacteriales bacterium OttesenSCG-928-G02]|nr:hypothetical protein [Eubacteriales bacterium OttesenSCG-928-G02]